MATNKVSSKVSSATPAPVPAPAATPAWVVAVSLAVALALALALVLVLVLIVGARPDTPVAEEEVPATPVATVTVAVTPTVAPTAPAEAPTPSAGPGCALLGGNPPVGSVCFPREMDPDSGYGIPYRIPVSEGGYSIVSLGLGIFNGQSLYPISPEIGHIVVISGTIPDGSTPSDLNRGVTLTGYTPGSVAVTHVVTPAAPALVAGSEHARAMGLAPNCGAEGCRKAYLWLWDWESSELMLVEVFDLTK